MPEKKVRVVYHAPNLTKIKRYKHVGIKACGVNVFFQLENIFDAYLQGATIQQIVELLKEKEVSSPTGREVWCKKTIDDILSNEKYVGDVILMKTIHIGGPGSKRVKNRGEADQYKATASHQAIISREQFDAVQKEKERRCNVETTSEGRVRKSIRYKSTFKFSDFSSEREE